MAIIRLAKPQIILGIQEPWFLHQFLYFSKLQFSPLPSKGNTYPVLRFKWGGKKVHKVPSIVTSLLVFNK